MIARIPRTLIITEDGKYRKPVRWEVVYSNSFGRLMAVAVFQAIDDPSDECLVEEFCCDIPEDKELPEIVMN